MEIIKTTIEGLVVIQPKVFEDERGYFMESYKESFIKENFPDIQFIQDNESKSNYGVLRGLHFQKAPFEQTKLVRVVYGKVLDIVMDLRVSSDTYGEIVSFILSSQNKKQLLIPKGFGHAFLVLSDSAIFKYKVDEVYNPEMEGGINLLKENLNINFEIPIEDIFLSQKDHSWPSYSEHLNQTQ